MRNPPHGRVDELDGVRALAIAAVLCLHGRIIKGGFLGVDIFFVLSGFLITSLLLREQTRTGSVSLAAFYRRRALRIGPPIIVGLGLSFALRGIDPTKAAAPVLFFYANLVPMERLGTLSHLWSLAIEEQFYFIWPALFLATSKRLAVVTALLVSVVIASATYRIVMFDPLADSQMLYRSPLARSDALAIGCLIAFMIGRGWRLRSSFALVLPVAAFVFLFYYAAWNWSAMMTIGYTVCAILAAIMIAALISIDEGHPLRKLARCKFAVYIGRRSYGIYVYHLAIFSALDPLIDVSYRPSFYFVFIPRVVITLIVAELSYRYIERPIMSSGPKVASSNPVGT